MSKERERRSRLPNPPRRRDDARIAQEGASWLPPSQLPGRAWRSSLESKLRLLPRQPGVYLFRDMRGRVLYVGKAKALHLRVRSYFRAPEPESVRLSGLRTRIRGLDYVVTLSEMEALILEAHLIKQHSPPFNIRLKDDTKYPYIKITTGHPYPGMFLTREVVADGSRYFGPFTRVKDLRRTLKTLRAVFQLRNCSDRRLLMPRECLQFFLGNCTAPCTQRVDSAGYSLQVEPLLDFLSGRGEEVIPTLRERMLSAAQATRFEESARLRDGIQTLEGLLREQRMTPQVEVETEVVGIAARGNRACAVFLHVSEGKVVGKSHRLLAGVRESPEPEILRALLLSLYLEAPRVPGRIVTSVEPHDRAGLEAALERRSGHPLRIRPAMRGQLKKLLEAAIENAHLMLEEEELLAAQKRARVGRAVYALQKQLDLPGPPYRIEGYDISNLQSSLAVASQVVFQDGKPLKGAYRRFRMAAIPGPDDFAMIAAVLRRRLARLQSRAEAPPDLILVDGGLGQVSRAKDVLAEMGFAHLPLVGLAKREEEVYLPGAGQPIRLPRNSEALQLLQRVRDEAHRFAVGYHRKLRTRAQRASQLEQIAGIGPSRRRELLRRFGSLDGIRQAGEEDLASIRGIGPQLARALKQALTEPGGEAAEERGGSGSTA